MLLRESRRPLDQEQITGGTHSSQLQSTRVYGSTSTAFAPPITNSDNCAYVKGSDPYQNPSKPIKAHQNPSKTQSKPIKIQSKPIKNPIKAHQNPIKTHQSPSKSNQNPIKTFMVKLTVSVLLSNAMNPGPEVYLCH